MEYIGFILWMVLYPISTSITGYLSAKQRKIEGKQPYDSGINAFVALINIVIWALIGSSLFNSAATLP